jgi:hypothetical protein
MKVAVKDFPFTYDGQRDEAIAGCTRVADDHPLVAEHPDCWRDEGLQDELRIRSERLRELERRAARPAEDRDWPESVRRQRDENRFWSRMLDELDPEDHDRDRGLDAVEAFDAETARSAREDIDELWPANRLESGWQGRIEG